VYIMKTYNILLYNDFFHEWEIVKTNIPQTKLKYFIFNYVNWYDLKIDFWEMLKQSGYKFIAFKDSNADAFWDDIKKEYCIAENNDFFVNDFYYDI